MSQISSDPPIWPSQFIPGVGSVPGGPRVRTRITPGGDTEIQPSTGSAVVIPKSEEPVVHLNTLPTFEQIQEVLDNLPEDGEITSEEVNESFGEAAEGQPIKLEPDTESPTGLNEDYEDYENHFARLLAAHNAANRSHSGSSGRQESYNGPVRERTESRIATTSRERSRSPTRLRASTARRSERESPMFFPDKRECRDSGIGMSASPDPRRSHNDGSVSMSGTPSGEPPSAYQYDELVSRCQCPIGYTCPHRPADKLDCRPLVLEWKNWEDRQHQEAFDR